MADEPAEEPADGRAAKPIRPGRVLRRAAMTCLGLLVLYFAIPVGENDSPAALTLRISASLIAFIGLFLAINLQLLRQINQPDAPLGGLLAGVVGGVLFFALVDYAVAINGEAEFAGLATRIDALYFTLSTFGTIGFGDVHAVGQFARAILCVQIIFNLAVLTTGAAMLARQIEARVRGRSRRHVKR